MTTSCLSSSQQNLNSICVSHLILSNSKKNEENKNIHSDIEKDQEQEMKENANMYSEVEEILKMMNQNFKLKEFKQFKLFDDYLTNNVDHLKQNNILKRIFPSNRNLIEFCKLFSKKSED